MHFLFSPPPRAYVFLMDRMVTSIETEAPKVLSCPILTLGQSSNVSGWHWHNAWCGQSFKIWRFLFGAIPLVWFC